MIIANTVTVEPRYNEPLCNEVLGISSDFLFPVEVEYMKITSM